MHCDERRRIIPTPLNAWQVAERAREICINTEGHLVTIMDTLTRLHHERTTTSEGSICALRRFRADLNLNNNFLLITDRGSHFASKAMNLMEETFDMHQKFAVSYAA